MARSVLWGLPIALAGAVATGVAHPALTPVAVAQTQNSGGLFYTYFGRKVPLTVRQDIIAAESKPGGTRSTDAEPFFLSLKRQLQGGGTRSANPRAAQVDVQPLGTEHALVSLPEGMQSRRAEIEKAIEQSPNVSATLPVLTRRDRPDEVIVLPNRIQVSFQANLSEAQIQDLLKRQNLEVISKEPFADRLYLVRARSAAGTAVLDIANQLGQVAGVEYATPDFIQSVPTQASESPPESEFRPESSSTQLGNVLASLPAPRETPFPSSLFPLLWNLDSQSLTNCLDQSANNWKCLSQAGGDRTSLPRTDIRVKEAWQQSQNRGKGVVVAVIDSLVQEHPDLRANLYSVNNPKCPSEKYGWDFSTNRPPIPGSACPPGDARTSLEPVELRSLRVNWRDAFALSDAELTQKYSRVAKALQRMCEIKQTNCSQAEIVERMRNRLRGSVMGEFHGTMVSGVVGAKSPDGKGLVGVAPNAQILPVRVFGLGGKFSPSALRRAIGYAADRGADVINMSLGATMPIVDESIVRQIAAVLTAHPKLVIVASAGNDGEGPYPDWVRFPACIPGVVSVGASNLKGNRASYSNYGVEGWTNPIGESCGAKLKQVLPTLDDDDLTLDVVAPGGDTQTPKPIQGAAIGGILTTGGTFSNGFWLNIPVPGKPCGNAFDPRGSYLWVDGTSFAAPAVAGVFALMKGEDPQRRLTRQDLVSILHKTASYQGLTVSPEDQKRFQTLQQQSQLPEGIKSPQEYFFGSGLVNAEAAVRQVKQRLGN